MPLWLRIRTDGKLIALFTAYDAKAQGSLIPVYRGIVFRNVVGTSGRLSPKTGRSSSPRERTRTSFRSRRRWDPRGSCPG